MDALILILMGLAPIVYSLIKIEKSMNLNLSALEKRINSIEKAIDRIEINNQEIGHKILTLKTNIAQADLNSLDDDIDWP